MKIKEFIKALAYVLSLSYVIAFIYVFLSAFFHPCKCIVLYFNNYNEYYIELFVAIICVISIILTIYWKFLGKNE